jgi:uncharacterized protein (TIGR02444 family)
VLAGDETNPLWRFAMAIYASDAVAPECLGVQSAYGVDVCLVLAAAFAGNRHRIVTPDMAREWAELTHHWRVSVVLPLRGVRQTLKTSTDPGHLALRKHILANELQAERLQLEMLWLAYEKTRLLSQPGLGCAECVSRSVQAVTALFTADPVPIPRLVAAASAYSD